MSITIEDKRISKSVPACSLSRGSFFEIWGELFIVTREGWALKLGDSHGASSTSGLFVTPVDVEINIVG